MREAVAHAHCTPDRDAGLAVTGRRSSFRVQLLDGRELFSFLFCFVLLLLFLPEIQPFVAVTVLQLGFGPVWRQTDGNTDDSP